MTCSRVIIINRGRIEASDTPQNLRNKLHLSGGILLEVKTPDPSTISAELKKISGITDVTASELGDGWQRLTIEAESGKDLREEVFRMALEKRWNVRELTSRRATLEDVFTQITQSEEN